MKEKTLETPLDCKEIQTVHPKGDQSWVFIGRACWSWNSNTSTTWCKVLTHLKRPWCWERLRAGGEGVDRGWDGWMASLTQWTWVWVGSGSWYWPWRPGVQQLMGSQRIGRDWTTELSWMLSESRSFSAMLFTAVYPSMLRAVSVRAGIQIFRGLKSRDVASPVAQLV